MRARVTRTASVLALATAVVAALALGGCAPTGDAGESVTPTATARFPEPLQYPDIPVIENLDYGSRGDGILLDVCLPEEAAPTTVGTDEPDTSQPRPAVVSVHGGSWRQGDKANPYWRSVCQWLASEGFVTFSLNYRLAPADPYPAGITDVRRAVQWIREDRQAERFDIDPARLGAFGGSAGGNLVALLGLGGVGAYDEGSRVRAVVDLSGPMDLTPAGFALGGVVPEFRQVQLDYLGCASYDNCPTARDASPLYAVDPSDPPFFVAHSTGERIPIEQSDALVEELRDAGVDTTYVQVEGELHSIAMLDDDLRRRIGVWLRAKLA